MGSFYRFEKISGCFIYSLSLLTNILVCFFRLCRLGRGSGATVLTSAGGAAGSALTQALLVSPVYIRLSPTIQSVQWDLEIVYPRSRVDCNYEWIRRLCIRRSRSASGSPSTETGEILTVVVEEYGTATVSWSYQNSQLRVFIFTVLSFRCEMFVPGPEPVPLLLIPFPVPLRSHSIMIKVQTWHFIVL